MKIKKFIIDFIQMTIFTCIVCVVVIIVLMVFFYVLFLIPRGIFQPIAFVSMIALISGILYAICERWK